MIRRYLRNLIIFLLIAGTGWFLWRRTEINSFSDAFLQLKKDGNQLISSIKSVSFSGKQKQKNSIKIASFDLTDFNDQKLDNPVVRQTLTKVIAKFDVIAIQGIQSRDHDALPQLMDHLKQLDPNFDYVIGPRSSHTALHHQFAFIYNRSHVKLEREQVYTIQDPDDVVAHDPLVGWFKAKGPNEDTSFTFTLINLRIDPTNKSAEHGILKKIRLAVKSDGHQEDDVLLIGNFHENSLSMQNLKTIPGYDFVITQDTTDLFGERQLSNIAFPVQASAEFTGRAGVVDFLTEYNLSVEDAKKISNHLPIWAEFYVSEGAAAGYVASIGN